MNKPRGKEKRISINARVDAETIKILAKLKELWSKSLGEVIDQLAKEQTPDGNINHST